MAMTVRAEAARFNFIERQHKFLDRAFGSVDFRRAHLRKILFLQYFGVRHRLAHVDLELLHFALELFAKPLHQRILHALERLLVRLRRSAVDLRQRHAHELFEIIAALEENAERLIEQDRLFVPFHEDSMQGPVEVIACPDMRRRHR